MQRLLLFFALTIFACGQPPSKEKAPTTDTSTPQEKKPYDWKEEYAYHTGIQAFVYGYPAIYYANLRYGMIENPRGLVSMPINTYFHVRTPALPEHQYGGSPNRDTPYSLAFVNLTEEPYVLTAPKIDDNRYFAIQLVDMYSDVFDYIGNRTLGNPEGKYLVIGPNYRGNLVSSGFKKIYHCPTNWMWIVSRSYSDNSEADLKIVHQIQDGQKIIPLSKWGTDYTAPDDRDVLDPAPPNDPLGAFKTLNAVMKENPPPARDETLMRLFAQIGLGPYAEGDIESLDDSIKKGLMRAAKDGVQLLKEVSVAGGSITGQSKYVNNWFYGPKNWGRMYEDYDFLGRASPQAFSGIVEHHIEESSKLRTFKDENGEALHCKNKYTLHFEKEQVPQPKSFWSLTVYNDKFNLVANDANIYKVGSDKNMKFNEDGSLTLYIQAEPPGEEKINNWLPVPKDGHFNLFLRSYIPENSFLDQTYIAPPVKKIN